MFGSQRFKWGISIDDMWRYADVEPPKSVIIPYLFSVRLPRGPIRSDLNVDPKSIESEMNQESQSDLADKTTRSISEELACGLKNQGVDFVRCWFPWNFFEPKLTIDDTPQYQFPLDNFVSAMIEKNIEILPVIGNGYSRFLPHGTNTNDSKDYVQRMIKMVSAVVGHYRNSISVWQIENEPNWWDKHYAAHWRSGGIWVEQGIRELILGALHDTVREADSNATIIINLEADEKKTDWPFYAKYCDVLGLDFYPNYFHSSPVDASEVSFSSEVKKSTELPVFVAETGYPSGPSFFGFDVIKQAQYIRSACVESFACEYITGLCLWRHSDSYWRSFPFQENYFGLHSKEGDPKPAWVEYRSQIASKR
jgi:hypothetical protein